MEYAEKNASWECGVTLCFLIPRKSRMADIKHYDFQVNLPGTVADQSVGHP